MFNKPLCFLDGRSMVAAKNVKMCDGTVADVKSLAPAVDSAAKLGQFGQS